MPGPLLDVAHSRTALRVKRGSRMRFIAFWIFVGVIGIVSLAAGAVLGSVMLAACTLVGVVTGALVYRDRCSACRASLPVRVFDEACPSCGAIIVGVEDDGQRIDLPGVGRRGGDVDKPRDPTPYRAGSGAARDAEDAAQRLATRTDVDARKKRLREDPEIARALRDRDERALSTLLRARRKRAKSIAEEEAIDALLADPRRHLEPKKRPWLGARASSGLVLSAARDREDEDGSFLADQLLVLGGYLILPLGSYVVRRRERGHGVEILGRVPMAFWKRLWRAVVALPVGIGIAVGLVIGAQAWWASRVSDVHLINALDIAVTVAAGGKSVKLGPGAREVRALAKGRHHLVTRDERGATIEEQDIDVPGGHVLVVYNVVGASPLVAREVFYSRFGDAPKDLREELLIGQRVLVREDVAYPFVEAPREIPERSDFRTWEVTRLPGGWRGAIEAVREHARGLQQVDMTALLEAVSLAEPENEDAVNAAVDAILEREGVGAARGHLEKLAARAPGSAAVRAAEVRLRGAER